VQPRLAHLEPVGLHRDRLLAPQELHDGLERLLHPRPLCHGLDAQHVRVDTSAPGPQPSMARPRVMWSSWTKRWATGRVVVRQARHAGASMMWRVRSAAAAMKISGEAISSHPPSDARRPHTSS